MQGEAKGLLVHLTDAGGVSRSGFYGGVRAGDAFTVWYAEGCWGHYEVAGVLADPPAVPRKRFAIEGVSYEFGACRDAAGEFRVGAGAGVEFRWGPPPPHRVGADGIAVMRGGQPAEGGRAYRVSSTLVIDVPAGMRLIYTGSARDNTGTLALGLKDEESGSWLALDPWIGFELGRTIIASGASGSSRDVGALFDAIVASSRTAP